MTALSRCFVLIVVSSIFAVTLPIRAEVPQPPRQRMSCCAHMAGERGHCGGSEPMKSQDRLTTAKNLSAKSLVHHRDPIVRSFRRRAFNHRFASARSRVSEM